MDNKDLAARALGLFDRFADMPHAVLSRELMALRREDADLCAALMALLEADERTHAFVSPLHWYAARHMDGGVCAPLADGTRLGAWRIEGVIGMGGMGVVYGACRADGLYEREVALKTVRAELASPQLLQAFGKERTHLAKLEHPAIVTLFDAGIADDGQPWLAMQRIDGLPIDQWCDVHRLDLRGRVRLLVDACDAISYAHAHGVLHQDIKPSNLLVTGEARVKLLDFGLSSMLNQQSGSTFARVGVSANYAAPEVFEGAPPSVAIDVYALGVVLYRLICGGWPRKPNAVVGVLSDPVNACSPGMIADKSAQESAVQRAQTNPRALSRALQGDLDAVALRCVELDPVARYPSVADLRSDLQAWLERRPVEARRGGPLYRTSRFLRRHALAAGVACSMIAAMAAVAMVVSRQHQRALVEAENTKVMSELFEQSLNAATLNTVGTEPLSSQRLLEDAERQLRSVAGDDRPRFLAQGLDLLAHSHEVRGDFARAERMYRESRALSIDDPLLLAKADVGLANLLGRRMKLADVERLVREGLMALQDHPGDDAAMVRLQLQFQMARSFWLQGDEPNALAILDEAIQSTPSLGDKAVSTRASLLRQRATILMSVGRANEAQQDLYAALALLDERSPLVRNQVLQTLAIVLVKTGEGRRAHGFAADALINSIQVFGSSHVETGRAWLTIAKTWHHSMSDQRRATLALMQAENIITERLGPEHPMLEEVLDLRATLETARGNPGKALVCMRRALAIAEHTYGKDVESTFLRRHHLATVLVAVARGSTASRQAHYYQEAEALLSELVRQGQAHVDRTHASVSVDEDEQRLRDVVAKAAVLLAQIRRR